VVADVLLPDMAGPDLRRALLEQPETEGLPLLLIQPLVAPRRRLRLFIDPDLYLSEPVDLHELPRRVASAARPRASRITGEVFDVGELRVDTGAHRVYVAGAEILLTALEFRLLVTFLAARGRVLTREQLLCDAWGVRSRADTRTVDTNVKRLRHKLGPAAAAIETIRNVGYRFGRADDAAQAETSTSMPAPTPLSSATGTSPVGHAS
jgi:two-component system phosphate regulon response regulator PhoB